MKHKTTIVWLVLAPLLGCGTRLASRGGFDSLDPASKLRAILQAGQTRNRSAIEPLIEQLDSDDPTVRMMSIVALERIAGTRMGYNPYASPQDRLPAIQAWVRAFRQNTLHPPDQP